MSPPPPPSYAPAIPATCPRCGRDAPIVYRGVVPYCTACGALRMPLSGPSVNLAGKPSRVGGSVAAVLGWLILLVGLSMALATGLLFAALHLIGLAVVFALPVAVVSSVAGGLLVRKGATLSREGAAMARATREQALLALAAHRGSIHAVDAAHALGTSVQEADAMLTDLAKRQPDLLAVDVEEQGDVAYRFVDTRVRVEGGPRVDVMRGVDTAAGGSAEEDAEPLGGMATRRTVPRA